MVRVLFICSQNRLRSPTAEVIYKDRVGLEVASAGLNPDATKPLTTSLVQWADFIFVMEQSHKNKLTKKWRSELLGKRVINLDIPDEYEFMNPDLIILLRARIEPWLPIDAGN